VLAGFLAVQLDHYRSSQQDTAEAVQLEEQADAGFPNGLRDHALIFFILFIAGGALLQYLVIGRVRRIQTGIAALERGDYAVRLPATGRDELAELAQSFNRMASAIAVRDQQFRVALDSIRDAFVVTDAATDEIRIWNPAAEQLFGYSAAEALGQQLHALLAPEHHERAARHSLAEFAQTGEGSAIGKTLEVEARHKDGTLLPIELSLSAMRQGERWMGLGVARDISERKRARQALEAERAFLQNVMDGIDDPILVIARDYTVLRMNRIARQASAVVQLDTSCLKCYQVSHQSEQPCSGTEHPCPLQEVLSTGRTCRVIHTHNGRNGEQRTLEMVATPLRDERRALIGIIESSRDITEQLALVEQLREKDLSYAHLVQHDTLTGLPNRLLFADRLSQGIRRAHRRGTKLAVLFVDLDRFKHINDSFDHNYGDEVLRSVAKRLRTIFREDDTLARMGSDEFAIILTELKQDSDAALVARKILGLFAESFKVQGHRLFLGACIGLSLYPEHGDSVDELVRNADAALHRAKEEGRNTYQYYSQDLTAKAFERILLEASLHQAVVHGELILHYQPQLDLASGEVCGVEALVRWQHPEMGLVSPARFIPLAEESGSILGIGEWVLYEATRQMQRWQTAGLMAESAIVSVNLSVKQFDQDDMIEMVHAALEDSSLSPGSLELEITESIMLQAPELAARRLARLRKLGARIAVDDFGTGYSSLSYLRSLPLTKLKVDQSFVSDLPHDPNDVAIAKAVIGLARSLSLEVLAEGIETDEQLNFLIREGCHTGQGYLFSRPLDANALEQYLRQRKGTAGWAD
jgi:diguanylate cyclase (GGDEF)-like protein/PAS domain S-box-containing protein